MRNPFKTIITKIVVGKLNEIDESDDLKEAGKDIVTKYTKEAEEKIGVKFGDKNAEAVVNEALDLIKDLAEGILEGIEEVKSGNINS